MNDSPIPASQFELARADPKVPVLVTGLASAAILSGTSEISLVCETRGADLEWGGVYGQGIRLTGPWTVRVVVDGRPYSLPESLQGMAVRRWGTESRHSMGGLLVTQEILPHPTLPAVARRLRFRNDTGATIKVGLATAFEPFLAPVLMEGIKPYLYEAVREGTGISIRSHGFGLNFRSDLPPRSYLVDQVHWTSERIEGEIREVRAEYDLEVAAGSETSIAWVVGGGLEHQPRIPTSGDPLDPAGAATWGRESTAIWTGWLSQTPCLRLPSAPDIERAYEWAKESIRSLYTQPVDGITGLVAGYPWYSAVWCRDLAWMLPAVLWMGDHDWAERSVRSVLGFQAKGAIPILAGEAGELPMQISAGPIFLYGTSDTSLYYPSLIRRISDHGARPGLADEFWPNLARIADWAEARRDRTTGLLRNGGEIEEVRLATSGLSRVNYGFDAVDTTIWDSTDRRDHAIDIQVLYWDALGALADLAGRRGDGVSQRLCSQRDALSEKIRESYWWPSEGYLFDSLRSDGTPVQKVRPNALRAVSSGLLPFDRAATVLARALKDDLAAVWGLRTLSSRDPGFVPTAYHDGQVWTIATAWAAEAAFALGDPSSGVRLLQVNADHIVSERGYAHECYRGDRPDPFNSCFLLGFSVAPFLTTVFEGLWGLRVGPNGTSITIEPNFPPKWTEGDLTGIKVGPGILDLAYRLGKFIARWSGPGLLTIRSDAESFDAVPGSTTVFTAPTRGKTS